MEHEEAIETMAAERYALGELDEMDREAFEEHFFDCAVCAESVRTGETLMDAGRALNPKVLPFRKPSRAPVWLSAAAAIAAIAILGYRGLTPQGPSAQIVSPAFYEGTVRAGAPTTTVVNVPKGGFGMLQFDITAAQPAPQYLAEVRDSGGRTVASLPISGDRAKDTVHMLLPAGSFPAGQYQLAVHAVRDGSRRDVVVSFPFVVRVE